MLEVARHAIEFRTADRAFHDRPAACAREIGKAFFQRRIAELRPRMDTAEAVVDPDQRALEFAALGDRIEKTTRLEAVASDERFLFG